MLTTAFEQSRELLNVFLRFNKTRLLIYLAVRQVIPPVFQLFIAICDCFTLVLSKSFPVQIQIRIDNFTAMNDLTISELIKFHGEEQGDSPALIYAGNTTCYT